MPTIPQSDLPIPESWDEFEDIVNFYARAWDGPYAHQGVDICGQTARLQGGTAGMQWRRYSERLLAANDAAYGKEHGIGLNSERDFVCVQSGAESGCGSSGYSCSAPCLTRACK